MVISYFWRILIVAGPETDWALHNNQVADELLGIQKCASFNDLLAGLKNHI